MLNVQVGDVITVHTSQQGTTCTMTVSRVARVYFYATRTDGGYEERFSLKDGRGSTNHNWPYATTAEQDDLSRRTTEATDTLKRHGVGLAWGHRLSLENLEALAEVAKTFPERG